MQGLPQAFEKKNVERDRKKSHKAEQRRKVLFLVIWNQSAFGLSVLLNIRRWEKSGLIYNTTLNVPLLESKRKEIP